MAELDIQRLHPIGVLRLGSVGEMRCQMRPVKAFRDDVSKRTRDEIRQVVPQLAEEHETEEWPRVVLGNSDHRLPRQILADPGRAPVPGRNPGQQFSFANALGHGLLTQRASELMVGKTIKHLFQVGWIKLAAGL